MPLNVMSASNMGIGEAGITAIFGYCVVFVGLVLLMLVLYIMGAVFKSKAKKAEALKAAEKAAAPAEAPAAEPETQEEGVKGRFSNVPVSRLEDPDNIQKQ